MDHKLLFETVLKTATIPMLFTDINIKSNWHTKKDFTNRIEMLYYKHKISEHSIDENKFKVYKDIYVKDNVWTWSREVPTFCSLYQI